MLPGPVTIANSPSIPCLVSFLVRSIVAGAAVECRSLLELHVRVHAGLIGKYNELGRGESLIRDTLRRGALASYRSERSSEGGQRGIIYSVSVDVMIRTEQWGPLELGAGPSSTRPP